MNDKKQIEEMAKVLNECCNEYDEQGNHLRNKCASCECWSDTNHVCVSYNTREAEALYNAGYRKQSENTIELPCKIGGTMYVVSRYYTGSWEIFKCKVDSITTYEKHTFISLISVKGNFVFGENVTSINKNVFFTEEKAKMAWAKMKGSAE